MPVNNCFFYSEKLFFLQLKTVFLQLKNFVLQLKTVIFTVKNCYIYSELYLLKRMRATSTGFNSMLFN